ncbi:MAG: FAD-binding and (Fe-S)-binding domain-containing protein [Terriglobales bacterium]
MRGKVHFDAGSRALYATDASNYRQFPIGLVLPMDSADVEAAIQACRGLNAPVLARGAATSLAGQCCNTAVVIDFSKFMHRILSVNPETRVAVVEPGVVLDSLRESAEIHELTFAPDPATHNRCTLGGMIGNNSCGTHSLLGGKTVDNIEEMEVLLYDGTRMQVGKTSEGELAAIIQAGGRKGEIYAGLKQIRDRYAGLIRERFPRIPRRVSGFNLDELLPERGFNVARALVGSEGTCVTVLESTVRLVKSPQDRSLIGLGFADAFVAADSVPWILEHDPIALEGFDDKLLQCLKRKGLACEELKIMPPGGAILLVEFGADSEEKSLALGRRLAMTARNFPQRPTVRIYNKIEARQAWFVRESALGGSSFVPGEDVGWEGWEDAAVEPSKLGGYLRSLFSLMQEFGFKSPLYGHFGHGCVHLRINFDFRTDSGIARYRQFIDRAADLVVSLGGSLSGEHGDGQSRGALLEKMFGPDLITAFRRFKTLWDPTNRMNPGKLIDADQPTDYLRINTAHPPIGMTTHFSFGNDRGLFENAALRCVGVGACRKEKSGTMCPSYMVTRDEKHSTRGRAHLLWEMTQGDILKGGWRNQQVFEALDLCLACKACKTECPVSVDMATYKAEFLAHYYKGRLRPIGDFVFGYIDKWVRIASLAPAIANLFASSKLPANLIKAALHIHPSRRLPRLASRTFRRQLNDLPPTPLTLARGEVLLWADTFNSYFRVETALAAHKVLSDAGFRVHVLKQHLCCGRPLYDFGFLDSARRYLLRVLDAIKIHLEKAMPVVLLEPSCATVFRDELTNLLPHDPRAIKLRDSTYLLSEFLVKYAPEYKPPLYRGTFVVQAHCHHDAIMRMTDEINLLRMTGADVHLLNSGCCGMAGPFGFQKEKYELSQKLAERGLLPAVRSASAETVFVADGFSCREQIAQNTEIHGVHLADVLAGGVRDRLEQGGHESKS